MGRINLYDVIQPHYTTFCEAVEPKSFIIHLPRLTSSDRDDITTHRTRVDQIFCLVQVINAKVKIDDLLRALMAAHLEELAETLENEYNSRRPTIRASRFEESTPSGNPGQNRTPEQVPPTRPPCPPRPITPPPAEPEPQPRQSAQATSQTDSDELANHAHRTTLNFYGPVNGGIQAGNGNHMNHKEMPQEISPDARSEWMMDNVDDSFSVVVDRRESSTPPTNNSKHELPSRSQSVQADAYHSPPTDPPMDMFPKSQSSSNQSRETCVKHSRDSSLSTISSSAERPTENSTDRAGFLGVSLRNNPGESIPSEDDETRVKQRYSSSSLPTMSRRDADVVATGVGGVPVTNAGSITTSLSLPCNVSVPVRNQANVTTSSKAPATGSVCPIPNEDTGKPRSVCTTAYETTVQNSGDAHALIPSVNESNDQDDSLFNSCDFINLKSSAELTAERLAAEKLANERRMNTGGARPKTVNQLPSGSSASFIMSNFSETEDFQSKIVERQCAIQKTSEVKINDTVVTNGNALNNSESASNNGLRIDKVGELKCEGNSKTEITVDQLATGCSDSFMMNSEDYGSTEDVRKEMVPEQRAINVGAKINDTGIITLNNLNSSCDDSFVMSDGNVIDDTVVDGEECEDKVAVKEGMDVNVCDVITPSVMTSESIPAVKSYSSVFLPSAVKLLLSIFLANEKCTKS